MCFVCGVYASHMRAVYVSQPVRPYFAKIRPYFGSDVNCVANTAQKKHKKNSLSTSSAQNRHMCGFALHMRTVCALLAYRLRSVYVTVYVRHKIRPYFVQNAQNKALFF